MVSRRSGAVQGGGGRGGAATSCRRAARLLHVMGLLAGKWPHSLAFQPGGVTRALDLGEKMRLIAVLGDFRAFAEKTLFGAPLEQVVDLSTPEAFRAYFCRWAGRFRRFFARRRQPGSFRARQMRFAAFEFRRL